MIINNKPKISVVLCTQNGELFLKQQLSSIAAQSLSPTELVISDDASNDTTLDIIKTFTINSDITVVLNQNSQIRGVVDNYSHALSLCSGDYLALCDQDDLWLSNKLETDYKLLQDTEFIMGKVHPILVHSDPIVINESDSEISRSFMKMRHIKHIDDKPLLLLLVQNFVTGCTVMLNRPLLEIALPIPQTAIMHDWWLALLAAACGTIVFNKNQTVKYRQHKSNVIGASNFISYNSFKRLLNLQTQKSELAAVLLQAKQLQKKLQNNSGFNDSTALDRFLAAVDESSINATVTAKKIGLNKAGLFRNLIFYLLLLTGSYQKH